MEKENNPPAQPKLHSSADMVGSSVDEDSKNPEKGIDAEKSDEDYPHGLKLGFIILGLCLAVFLIAIGEAYDHRWKNID